MKKIAVRLAPVAFLVFPLVSFAVTDLSGVINLLKTLIGQVIPVVIALAALLFIWGLIKYITAAGNAESQSEGRQYMLWAVIALFVMLSFWGLVNILGGTLQLNTTPPQLPQLPS